MVIKSLLNVHARMYVYFLYTLCAVVGPAVAIISGGQDAVGKDEQTLEDAIRSVEIFSPFATVSCNIPNFPIGRHASNI